MAATQTTGDPDFPLPIPELDGTPVEWTPEAIAQLTLLPANELQDHLVALLKWYIQEDDVSLEMVGNEYWAAGYHMAQALVAASEQKISS